MGSFEAEVSRHILKYKHLTDAVARQSVSDLVDEVLKPKAKGGRMPVDTGFLRLSGQMSLTGMPTGPVRGDKTEKDSYGAPSYTTTIAGIKAGVTVYFGFTANYARLQNLYNGFLTIPVQNWQKIVNSVVRKLAKRI